MNDHRQMGRELGLFDSDALIGAGLPYWLPAGAAIRHAIEEFVREVERRAGYQHVYSPVLGKRELYEISGHWAHYRDDMFPPMSAGGDQMVLRPSLCPHHAVIYRSRQRSYHELPLRIAELGGQFREEASGALGGLTRVRAMQLNDAHVPRSQVPTAEPSAPGSETTALCLTKPSSAPVKPTATPFPCASAPAWPLIPSRSGTHLITSGRQLIPSRSGMQLITSGTQLITSGTQPRWVRRVPFPGCRSS